MGHQLNFFLTPRDTAGLESRLREIGPLVVLHKQAPTSQPRVLPNIECVDSGRRWLYFCLVRPDDLPSVVMRHVPAQGYWTVDELRSPAIELTACYFDDRILRRGRLYYVDKYYGTDGAQVKKPDDFLAWAKAVLAATRKHLIRVGSDYAGAEALEWRDAQRELVV